MKFRTPWQVHKDREEKRNLEFEIDEAGRLHQLTLKEEYRIEIIKLRMDYKIKYKKEYKG